MLVVDESHNAESELSVEMLGNLNPSIILDLTATPQQQQHHFVYRYWQAQKRQYGQTADHGQKPDPEK